jgi:hypothetical protein
MQSSPKTSLGSQNPHLHRKTETED